MNPVLARLRAMANLVNGSTLAGLAVAKLAGCTIQRGAESTLVVPDYPRVFPAPKAVAVCVGNVILVRRSPLQIAALPHLLAHERRHCTQWALCLGPLGFIPLYAVASAWSMLRHGNPATANIFEVDAGLAAGGYRLPTTPAVPLGTYARQAAERASRTLRNLPTNIGSAAMAAGSSSSSSKTR